MTAGSAARPSQVADRRGRIGRAALAAAVLGFGLWAASSPLALALRRSAPDLAVEIAPRHARIAALQAEAMTAGTTSLARWDRAADVARRALLRDPLLPSATATLGFRAALRGDDRAARRAFAYSRAISRRDLKTHLSAIEYAVSRGDVTGALSHYDLALLTSRQAPAILFPVLAAALASDDIRRGLAPLLLRKPQWAAPFVNFVANSSPDHRSAAALFGDLGARRFVFPSGAEASLLGALVTGRDYQTARSYLTRAEPRRDFRTSRTPRFAGAPATPSPFDWNPQNDVGLTSSIQRGDGGGVFAFSAVAGAGGPVLRQLQLLPPGRYEVVSRLTALDPADVPLFWTVRCVDGAEIARLPVKAAGRGAPAPAGRFAVGPGCPAQWLTLVVTPVDRAGGLAGEMDFAQIRPVAERGR